MRVFMYQLIDTERPTTAALRAAVGIFFLLEMGAITKNESHFGGQTSSMGAIV